MRIFTKTVKVLGVTKDELGALDRLLLEAKARDQAEIQIGPNSYLAIEVSEDHRFLGRRPTEDRPSKPRP